MAKTIFVHPSELMPVGNTDFGDGHYSLTESGGTVTAQVANTTTSSEDLELIAVVPDTLSSLLDGYTVNTVRIGGTGGGTNGIDSQTVEFYKVATDDDGTTTETSLSHSVTESTGTDDFEDSYTLKGDVNANLGVEERFVTFINIATGSAADDTGSIAYVEFDIEI